MLNRYIFLHTRSNRGYYYDTAGHKVMVFIPDYAKGTSWDKESLLETLSTPLTAFLSTLLYILYRRFSPPVLHVNALPVYVLAACLTGLLLALLTARATNRGHRRQIHHLTEVSGMEASAVYRTLRKNTRTLTITAIVLLPLLVAYPLFLKVKGSIVEWLSYITFWYVLWLIVCVVRLDRRWKIIKIIKKERGEET